MRICIIGCGDIAKAAHGPVLKRLAQENVCELLGCCANHLEHARNFKERFDFEYAYNNYHQMLEELNPDAVFLFLPVKMIAACAADVMCQGFSVIMEKPPGISVRETDMLIRTARHTGQFNAVLFNRRSMPLVQLLKKRLNGEEIQAVSLEMCRWNRTNEDFTTTAIHGIDCVSYLVGVEYSKLHFSYQKTGRTGQENTNYYITGTMKNGVHADLRFLPNAGAVTERISVYVRGGQFYLQMPVWSGTDYAEGLDFPGSLKIVRNQKIEFYCTGEECSKCRESYILNGFYEEDRTILLALRHRQPSVFPISSGKQPVEIAEALRTGQTCYDLN